MSKQLAISAAFSVFTMAAFALFATAGGTAGQIVPAPGSSWAEEIAGAPIAIEAPANLLQRP